MSLGFPQVFRLALAFRNVRGAAVTTRLPRARQNFFSCILHGCRVHDGLTKLFVGIPAIANFTNEVQLPAGGEANTKATLSFSQARERSEDLDGA